MTIIGPQPRPHRRNPYIKKVVDAVAEAIDPKAFEPIPEGPEDEPSAFQRDREKKVEELKLLKETMQKEAIETARRAIVMYLHITDKLSPKRLAS